MKRILLACFLITATLTATMSANKAQASASVAPTAFTTKVNQMDSLLALGNVTQAQTTWDQIHSMMLAALSDSKENIHVSPSTATNAALQNQVAIYKQVWALKPNLLANRNAIHLRLLDFAATL